MDDNDKRITTLLKENEIFFTSFEPKTLTRFLCNMTYKDGKKVLPAYVINGITRPSVERRNKQWIWNPIEIKVYDPIVPSSAQALYHYLLTNEPLRFDMSIEVMGPCGDSVERWEIEDAEISGVDFGIMTWCEEVKEKAKLEALNFTRYYRGSDPVEITATIVYDFAKLVY